VLFGFQLFSLLDFFTLFRGGGVDEDVVCFYGVCSMGEDLDSFLLEFFGDLGGLIIYSDEIMKTKVS
jgi:hypothetical protein